MKLKPYIKPFLVSHILLLLIAPIGGVLGHHYKVAAAATLFCLLTVVLLAEKGNRNHFLVMLAIILPMLLIYAPLYIYRFQETLFSFPSFAAHFLGVAAGLAFTYSRHAILRIGIVAFVLLVAGWTISDGYSMWLNRVNFGSFTGKVSIPAKPFVVSNSNGQEMTNRDLRGKVVVFDFWNTGCGVCFEKFPVLEEIATRFQNHQGIEFYAVNIPLKRDKAGYSRKIWQDLRYTVPSLFAPNLQTAETFGITAYPTTLIIKDGTTIIYKGNIEGAEKILKAEAKL